MSSVSLNILGCSGTSAPQAPRLYYGHHTSSFAVIQGDALILIDNGSGVEQALPLVEALGVVRAYMLQTHLHADHILGLPQNKVLMQPGLVRRICSACHDGETVEDAYRFFAKRAHWPVGPTGHTFHIFEPGEELDLEGIQVRTFLLAHPEGSIAYRIETPLGAIVIATDAEFNKPSSQRRFGQFISGAALVYVDCQFRVREYNGEVGVSVADKPRSRVGFGHSTPAMLRGVLHRTPSLPEQLILGHHDPMRDDADIARFGAEVRDELWELVQQETLTGGKGLRYIGFAAEKANVYKPGEPVSDELRDCGL